MRKLVTIQKIRDIQPIKGADRIEKLSILGWECVGKKGEFKIDDYCVYFEIDSMLPEIDIFEFMRPRKFRVKTAKFRKQISQGLAMPISILKDLGCSGVELKEGVDITALTGVIKHDPEALKEKNNPAKIKNPIVKYMMRFLIFRKIYNSFFPKFKEKFPDFIPKTDEERVQNLPDIAEKYNGCVFYCTEKLDGQSITIFYNSKLNSWYRPWVDKAFGVCSRNIWLKTKTSCNWWDIVGQYDLKKKLKQYCKKKKINLALQCEIIGEGIQKNKYGIKGIDIYGFSIYDIDRQEYLSKDIKNQVFDALGIKNVPLYKTVVINKDLHDTRYFIDMSKKVSELRDIPCEGLVFRQFKDDSISFKAINPEFLLKYDL